MFVKKNRFFLNDLFTTFFFKRLISTYLRLLLKLRGQFNKKENNNKICYIHIIVNVILFIELFYHLLNLY